MATVDSTLAPAKILSVTELKNGNVYVATEAKIYQLLDGKLRPLIWADAEHEAVLAGAVPAAAGAVPAAPPPPPPPAPVKPASTGMFVTTTNLAPVTT
jgi:hypothetical protein